MIKRNTDPICDIMLKSGLIFMNMSTYIAVIIVTNSLLHTLHDVIWGQWSGDELCDKNDHK